MPIKQHRAQTQLLNKKPHSAILGCLLKRRARFQKVFHSISDLETQILSVVLNFNQCIPQQYLLLALWGNPFSGFETCLRNLETWIHVHCLLWCCHCFRNFRQNFRFQRYRLAKGVRDITLVSDVFWRETFLFFPPEIFRNLFIWGKCHENGLPRFRKYTFFKSCVHRQTFGIQK